MNVSQHARRLVRTGIRRTVVWVLADPLLRREVSKAMVAEWMKGRP